MNILKNRNNIIEYTVSKDINTGIYISVQNGEVVVNAPWYFTSNQIQEIVEQRKKWILKKRYEQKRNKELQRKITKENVIIMGKQYSIKINYKNITVPEVNLKKEKVEIILPNKYKNIDNTKILNLIIDKLFMKIAEEEIEMAMEKSRILLGFAPEDFKIEKIENLLGKCENKVITISPVMHEYCHLKYKTHSKRFIELIEKYQKNYKCIENIISEYKF